MSASLYLKSKSSNERLLHMIMCLVCMVETQTMAILMFCAS
jgi:hypothetical protein